MSEKLSERAFKGWRAYKNNVDEKTKLRIKTLSEQASHLFRVHRQVCEEIERLLLDISDKPIVDVVYQPSDGIVAVVDNCYLVPDNIPIEQFLEE